MAQATQAEPKPPERFHPPLCYSFDAYAVVPKGVPFPMDMLQRDQCFPVNSGSCRDMAATDRTRIVQLRRYHGDKNAHPFTTSAWLYSNVVIYGTLEEAAKAAADTMPEMHCLHASTLPLADPRRPVFLRRCDDSPLRAVRHCDYCDGVVYQEAAAGRGAVPEGASSAVTAPSLTAREPKHEPGAAEKADLRAVTDGAH